MLQFLQIHPLLQVLRDCCLAGTSKAQDAPSSRASGIGRHLWAYHTHLPGQECLLPPCSGMFVDPMFLMA